VNGTVDAQIADREPHEDSSKPRFTRPGEQRIVIEVPPEAMRYDRQSSACGNSTGEKLARRIESGEPHVESGVCERRLVLARIVEAN
jgi:hypothetical protein